MNYYHFYGGYMLLNLSCYTLGKYYIRCIEEKTIKKPKTSIDYFI